MSFTPEEKELLKKYVTSTEDDIFAVRGMPGMVGAAYARYSRAKGGFREVLLKEFINEGNIDPKHADELIERILIAYGDDSVGELEGCHVSFENISMLATKEIEERRIGGSPIEQSTRYVLYDMKIEDKWRYLQHESLTQADFGAKYLETMDFIFGTYAALVDPMKEYFRTLKPLDSAEYDIDGDGKKEKIADLTDEKDMKAFKTTYNFDLRSKACDTLRALLPLATVTNVGLFGNGRFFQTLISHLLTSEIPEAQNIGEKAFKAASEVIPQYVRRAKRSEYGIEVTKKMLALPKESFGEISSQNHASEPNVALVDVWKDFDGFTIAAMLYRYAHVSLDELYKKVTVLTADQKKQIVSAYVGERKNRRDRPGRALELGYPYSFEMVTNFGVYKDLMRHRMNSQMRQLFTTKIGFEMPEEIKLAGLEEKAFDQYGKCVVAIDPRYFRPTEVDELLGDASKARIKLGWTHRTTFAELVAEMVAADLDAVDQETRRNDRSG